MNETLLGLQLKLVWTCVTTLFVLTCSIFMASEGNTHTVQSLYQCLCSVNTEQKCPVSSVHPTFMFYCVYYSIVFPVSCFWKLTHCRFLVCMLSSQWSIVLLAMHSLCKWACVLLYLYFSFASFCYVLSLLICTELPTWLLGWCGGYLVTCLHWTGGLLGWCWLPIWLTANAGAVLRHVANHRLLSLRLVWPANTQRQCSGTTPSWQPNVTMQLHVLKPCISLSF